MERELLMTGIGGQGVQLAAQLLAKAATRSGRHVQLFGSYGGMMRGGNTEATLIISDEPVLAPPMVSSAWSALVMHHEFAQPTLVRLLADGLLVINTSVVTEVTAVSELATAANGRVLAIPASEIAIKLGAAPAATMVALGAYAAATEIVTIAELIDTLPDVLPSYRSQHIASNARALLAGADAAADVRMAAWPEAAAVSG